MIERGVDGTPGRLDVGEIEHPAQHGIEIAGHDEFDLERMPVQPRTRMRLGERGQAARALQMKDAENVHAAFSPMRAALTTRTGRPGSSPATA